MKQITQKIKILFLAIGFAVALPVVLNAQPMPDSNDVDTPIDGGLTILLAAGAAFGAKKIRDVKKNNSFLKNKKQHISISSK